MSKKKSPTRKKTIETARKAGYDSANYVGQTNDGSNVYICTTDAPSFLGLPAFIKVKDGKSRRIDFKGAEFDECFKLLEKLEE